MRAVSLGAPCCTGYHDERGICHLFRGVRLVHLQEEFCVRDTKILREYLFKGLVPFLGLLIGKDLLADEECVFGGFLVASLTQPQTGEHLEGLKHPPWVLLSNTSSRLRSLLATGLGIRLVAQVCEMHLRKGEESMFG